MSSLVDMVSKIKSRPTMYIGERSIDCLRAFLEGWMIARSPSREDSEFMMGFQEWIQSQYDVHTSQSWARIIAFYTPDQAAALDKALDLLTEYSSCNGEVARRQENEIRPQPERLGTGNGDAAGVSLSAPPPNPVLPP